MYEAHEAHLAHQSHPAHHAHSAMSMLDCPDDFHRKKKGLPMDGRTDQPTDGHTLLQSQRINAMTTAVAVVAAERRTLSSFEPSVTNTFAYCRKMMICSLKEKYKL